MLISKNLPQIETKPNVFEKTETFENEEELYEETKYNGPTKIKASKKEEKYDEDLFLQNAMKEACFCMFKGCEKPIDMLKVVCVFCKKGFCYKHGLAETHGCGDRAHLSELSNPSRPAKLNSGKITELKDRLHSKIESLNNRKLDKKKKKK